MTAPDRPDRPIRTLVIGAGYGLLPAAKIALAGHPVTVVARPAEARALRSSGVEIRFADSAHLLRLPVAADTVSANRSPGLHLGTPDDIDPTAFDIAFLAVQEPQAADPPLRALLARIGDGVPVVSIMNLPPPPFLDRVPGLPDSLLAGVYGDPAVWAPIPAARLTMASPDPQAIRPDPAQPGAVMVSLASNFKLAPFARAQDQAVLARLARDASRGTVGGARVPVNMVTRGSIFVPLSKWPMLVTGNCRCVQAGATPIPLADAVHRDLATSRMLYDAVNAALGRLGAPDRALVPFDSYLAAARRLRHPSSLARGLANGACHVERIDRLVLNLLRAVDAPRSAQTEMEAVSARIDAALARNRGSIAAGPRHR